MVAAESSNQNFFSTTLSSSISDTDTTIPLTSLGSLTSPAYLVINPESDTKREVIYADGTWTGAAAVLSTSGNRGVDGSVSGAQSHNSGTTVVSVPLKQHLEDIHDRVDTHVHDGTTADSAVATGDLTGHDKAAHDALTLDHGSLSGLADFTADHGTQHDAHDHTFVDHGTLAGLADFDIDHGTEHDARSHSFVDHGTLTGLADFTADHGTEHDAHDHSTALGTGALSDLGSLDAGSSAITSVADPSSAQDAATKNYVDTRMVLGYAEKTTNTNNITTPTTLVSVNNVTLAAGEYIMVQGATSISHDDSNRTVLRIDQDGVEVGRIGENTGATAERTGMSGAVVLQPGAGTFDFDLVLTTTGQSDALATADSPTHMTVIKLGT